MESMGNITDISFSINKRLKITFEITENIPMDSLCILKDQLLDISIKKHREKRSLDANAYAWKLMTEIANVLRTTKDEVYMRMLKDYGQSDIIRMRKVIDPTPYFKYYDLESENNGFAYYRIYKGSSEYDTREMAILIDGIVYECKELNIETIPPKELESMKEAWGNEASKDKSNGHNKTMQNGSSTER